MSGSGPRSRGARVLPRPYQGCQPWLRTSGASRLVLATQKLDSITGRGTDAGRGRGGSMQRAFRWVGALGAFALAAFVLVGSTAVASHTPPPASVTIAGSLQSELGCPGDWDPGCALTGLTYDANDTVWQATFDVPAGGYEYKAALNGSWNENYGAGAQQNGPNIGLSLGTNRSVKFYYDHATHWLTDDVNSTIAVAPGSFQSELGCSGDWDPGCLRSWLQDPDGDGIYVFETTALPHGSYEAKVAINESWDENYGQGG